MWHGGALSRCLPSICLWIKVTFVWSVPRVRFLYSAALALCRIARPRSYATWVPVSLPEEQSGLSFDWEDHWDKRSSVPKATPGDELRSQLIRSMMPTDASGERILDIGSGLGTFALLIADEYPKAEVRGIELGASGVEHSRSVAAARGSSATFRQRDLQKPEPVAPEDARWATIAICSEVLEHVDDPALFLRYALEYLAPGCRLIITVPGGPRTPYDKHLGHRQHFTEASLRTVLTAGGVTDIHIYRNGFPWFNLYKLTVWLRSRALIENLNKSGGAPGRAEKLVTRVFRTLFRRTLRDFPLGWQLSASGIAPSNADNDREGAHPSTPV